MNKGFLMFSQEEGLTTLKDEPDDLTHLAPTAGDACIFLENSPFDMLDDYFNDNYCSLLGDDLANGSPVDALTPDSLLLSSPESQENDSSCEQSSLLTDLSLDAFDNNRSDNDIDDGNSPFIPSSDELPVVMWGALPDSVRLARPNPSEKQATSPAPALQRLLTATPTGPPPQDLITNIYSDQALIPSRGVTSWDTGVKRVINQEQEPCAKRAKRSPSPAQPPKSAAPSSSSSVLMNLLDLPQKPPQQIPQPHPNYQTLRNPHTQHIRGNIPIPVINLLQKIPTNQMMYTNTPLHQLRQTMNSPISNPMSPLSLNISSPMYSLPSSPNSYNSPAISPAQRDRVMSPYPTPQSLSPVGKFHQYSPGSRLMSPAGALKSCDPYLTTKMQPSPGFPLQPADMLLDSSVPLTATDFWPDTDLMQGTNDLLTALDDVKLV